jgi:chemotaxis methyl-accepting protein methylase/mannose-6-phosphate isomerase-like protein (cupin superfamily)
MKTMDKAKTRQVQFRGEGKVFAPDGAAETKTMPYIYSLPTSVSFTGKGLLGYTFGPLKQKDLEIYYIEVEKGHDKFMISQKITRTYYVLSGSGYFTIDNHKYEVGPGVLVEVPPRVEYCYSGKMTLIGLSKPRWFGGNDTFTKWNADVVGRSSTCAAGRESWWRRVVRMRIVGRSPIGGYLRLNQRLWSYLPSSFTALRPIDAYGNLLHALARIQVRREQAFSTFFLRNRPELELIRRLLDRKSKGDTLRVAVLGCSTGAEVYSVAWTIRSARPDLKLIVQAVDISKQAVECAQCGAYSRVASQLSATSILERMTAAEAEEFFDRDGNVMTVKSWIKEGIHWHVGDVGEPEVLDALGPQEMVVANNFLCHMDASEAERCLRTIARLVSPYGYLFVSGVDLDVRTKVARDLGWNPLQELLEEIHEGDPCMRNYWPFHYGGLEPLNKTRRDWRVRYAAAFQIAPTAVAGRIQHEDELGECVALAGVGPVLSRGE